MYLPYTELEKLMRSSFNKVPHTIRLTPIQAAAMASLRYSGSLAVIVRFFIDKLINDELPESLKKELEAHLNSNLEDAA